MVFSSSEMLLYGGIGLIAAAVVIALIATVSFILSGKKLQKKLDEEYGHPEKYNIKEKRIG